jgi:hypothetical protein
MKLGPLAIRRDKPILEMNLFRSLVGVIIAVLLLSSCRRADYRENYGIAFNPERLKRGIPTIPPGWKIDNDGYIDCYDPKPDTSKPYHLRKRVFVGSKGEIVGEEDAFYSGKSFEFYDHRKYDQEVEISYYYAKETNDNPWQITVMLDKDSRIKSAATLEEADQVLKSWGLSRTQ